MIRCVKTAWRVLIRSFINSVVAGQIMPRTWRNMFLRLWGMDLGKVEINPRCTFSNANIEMQDGVIIQWGVFFESAGRITLGRNVGISIESHLFTSSHKVGPPEQRYGEDVVMPLTIGDGTWVGARTVVMPGVTIGEGCIIGSNSVVTKDCEPNGFYAGAPARLIRKLPVGAEAEPLRQNLRRR